MPSPLSTSASPPSTPPEVMDGLPSPQRWQAFLVIILGLVMSVLDSTLLNLALPTISREMQASPAATIWVINAFQVAMLALLLPMALLGDLIGYRRVYLGGMVVFTVASLVCTFANSLPLLIAARFLQGLGSAGVLSVNTALVRQIFPKHLLGRGIATNSVVVATASVAGPPVAAAILSVASWPWLFAVNVPLGLLTIYLGRKVLPPNALNKGKVNLSLLDLMLNALMFSALFVGVDMLAVHGSSTGNWQRGLLILAFGAVIAVIYLRRQSQLALPLFPLDLLRIPVFTLSMCTSVTAFAAQMLALIALPFLFIEYHGMSAGQAGLLMAAWPVGTVMTAPIVGRLIGRVPGGLLGGVGLSLMAIGLASLALLPEQPTSTDFIWRLLVCGAGFGINQSPNNHTIVTSAPPHRSGGASGMLGTARLTGQSLGAVIVAVIFTLRPTAPSGEINGPTIALIVAAAFAVFSAMFSSLRISGQLSQNKPDTKVVGE